MNVAVTPLAFLALGAALTASRGAPFAAVEGGHATRPRWKLQVALGCLALVPAVLFVAGDAVERNANQHFSLSDAKLANALMPMWPLTAEQVGEIYAYESLVDPSDRDKYLTLSRESYAEGAARDPSDPSVWSQLAGADIALNEYGAARSAVSEALRDEPFSVPALTISGELYVTAAAWSRAISAFGEALSLDPGNVVLETDLSNARAHVAITEPK